MATGGLIIHEGDVADYYFLVLEGRCQLERLGEDGVAQAGQADLLGFGQGFGDDAIFAGSKYQASVAMLEDGRLLRLHKGEFLTLMVSPFMDPVTKEDAKEMMENGAVLLDIRSPSAFRRQSAPRITNLPLSLLPNLAAVLDPAVRYVITINSRRRSAIAAFYLACRGIKAATLRQM